MKETKTSKYIRSYLTKWQAAAFARKFVGGTVKELGYSFLVFGIKKKEKSLEVDKNFWHGVESTELKTY